MNEQLKAFAAATNNEMFDPVYKGGEWMVEAVETRETLEQFAESAQNWAARTAQKSGEIGGFKFIAWASCQAVKGQPRRKMLVVWPSWAMAASRLFESSKNRPYA